ncbi:sulfur carrier protein ThiS [Reyranella sp.]|jgi:sulfur carrier protein|uniref:sulfur carrier protein ThiS n=1 Tax=Reyranella sp. TaxID=1929291 RepID=UPI002F920665
MQIYVNGDQHDVEPGTLAVTLDALGFGGRKIATAVNGRFVAAAVRSTTKLAEGDQIEVVAPMQGG